MSDSELLDSDQLRTATQEVKKQQQKREKMADEEISSLLEAAQQQISLLKEELQTKQRVIEELQLKGTYS